MFLVGIEGFSHCWSKLTLEPLICRQQYPNSPNCFDNFVQMCPVCDITKNSVPLVGHLHTGCGLCKHVQCTYIVVAP